LIIPFFYKFFFDPTISRFYVAIRMGLACNLRTRYLLLELQFFIAQYWSIGIYRLPNETHQIWSRIGRSLSHALLSIQSKYLARKKSFCKALWD